MLAISNRLRMLYQREALLPALLIVGAFLCGLVCGALILHTLNQSQLLELRQYLDSQLKNSASFNSRSGLQLWSRALGWQLPTLGLIWVFGLTLVGVPLTLLMVGTRGFILGFTVGFLVQERAAQGLALALAGVLPQNLCYVPTLLAAGALSCYYSLSLWGRGVDRPLSSGLLVYSLLFGVAVLVMVVGAWVEAYFTPGLVHLVLVIS